VDSQLDELMADLPALALDGPRGVGKTATAARRASRVFQMDDEAQREIVAADRSVIEEAPGTVLLDEWQRYPPIWDYVRRSVDDGAPPGRFLLTGSAAPTEQPAHSGAGRIVSIRMRPMSLAERGLGPPTVSLGAMLAGERPAISGRTDVAVRDYVSEIFASGFPGIRGLAPRARHAQLKSYVSYVVEHDFPDQGLRVRRPGTLLAWLTAYAAATATNASYNALLDAATPGESAKPTKVTSIAYRDVLSQLWLLDPVPGWYPGNNQLHRLTQAPKHHLADPALAATLLGINPDALLHGERCESGVQWEGSLLGSLFESLVTLSTQVYAQANEARLFHLRTRSGDHEVDLIVERRDRRMVALEVKLGGTLQPEDFRHLRWLQERLGDDLLDAAVITASPQAYRRPDGIAVVPAVLLGP
jgi:hypothetical protein